MLNNVHTASYDHVTGSIWLNLQTISKQTPEFVFQLAIYLFYQNPCVHVSSREREEKKFPKWAFNNSNLCIDAHMMNINIYNFYSLFFYVMDHIYILYENKLIHHGCNMKVEPKVFCFENCKFHFTIQTRVFCGFENDQPQTNY